MESMIDRGSCVDEVVASVAVKYGVRPFAVGKWLHQGSAEFRRQLSELGRSENGQLNKSEGHLPVSMRQSRRSGGIRGKGAGRRDPLRAFYPIIGQWFQALL